MVERTPGDFGPTDESTDTAGGGDFLSRLERILKKPAVQQRLLAEAPEEVQQAVMSEFTDAPADEPSTDTAPSDPDDDDLTPEKLAEFLGEIEEQVGGDYTVTQLRAFAEANPGMVDNLLKQYL